MRASLCPHYSKGLLVQWTRKPSPTWWLVINLFPSNLTAVANQKIFSLLYEYIHTHTNKEKPAGFMNVNVYGK